MDLIIRNATVIDPVNQVNGIRDIGISDGRVTAVEEGLVCRGAKELDCSGKTVIPGVIDMHVHVTNSLGGHNGYAMIAKTGVTTAIDFAGPIDDITQHLPQIGCGLSLGCIDSVLPTLAGQDPSQRTISDFCDRTLAHGSLGLKILGGHFPLSPDASRIAIEQANRRRVMVAFHAGSTNQRSDIYGMREAVELAQGQRLLLAHINAYCRGKRYHYFEELHDAFAMLRENPNIISDSHLACMNGTMGYCEHGAPHDVITINCLELFGRPATEQGLADAILDGLVRVQGEFSGENVLLQGDEAYRHWRACGTRTMVSFPANLPTVGVACALERVVPGGEFLIQMTSTDGGGIPRNDLIGRILSLHHMGYLTLEEVVWKCSAAPASAFGLKDKGHLGVGADADLTILDKECRRAVGSFGLGKEIMRDGIVVGTGGCLLLGNHGEEIAKKKGLTYRVADVSSGMLYQAI